MPMPIDPDRPPAVCLSGRPGAAAVALYPEVPPDPAQPARVRALGPGAVEAPVRAGVKDLAEVKKWRTLRPQIMTAERKRDEADRLAKRAAAQLALLETEPQPDHLGAVKAAEADRDRAAADKRAAEADLARLKKLAPKLWLEAAEAIDGAARTERLARHDHLEARRREVEAKVRKAMAALVPLLAEFADLTFAVRDVLRDDPALVVVARSEALGPPPEGVRTNGKVLSVDPSYDPTPEADRPPRVEPVAAPPVVVNTVRQVR